MPNFGLQGALCLDACFVKMMGEQLSQVSKIQNARGSGKLRQNAIDLKPCSRGASLGVFLLLFCLSGVS